MNVLKRFTNRIFPLSDTLPDWNNNEFLGQNLENIPEHNITAQEVLEETILSSAENLLGTTEELDPFFPEEFIDLATWESIMNSSESIMNSSESIMNSSESIMNSSESNMFGTREELDHSSPEEFDLATLESFMNSFNIDHFPSLYNDNITLVGLDDWLVDTQEDVMDQNACQIPNDFVDDAVMSAPTPENHTVPEAISDTTAVVPDVVPQSHTSEPAPENDTISEPISDITTVVSDIVSESPMSVPESPANTTDAGVFSNSISLDINQVDPAFLALLQDLEKSAESNVQSNSKKRSLEVRNGPIEPSARKKKRQPSNCSTDVGTVFDSVAERRTKNNAASRVYRASRKAREKELLERKEKLSEENEVLKSKVNELTAAVMHLKKYVVNRLK